MTNEEFDKIKKIKEEIEILNSIIHNENIDAFTSIKAVTIMTKYNIPIHDNCEETVVIISKELSDAIKELMKERFEKLIKEFNNFKTE